MKINLSSILSVYLLLNITSISYALPEWQYEQFTKWVKNHKFLAPKVEENMTNLKASRQLANNHFIEVSNYCSDICIEELTLYKAEFSNNSWSYTDSVPIWDRKGETPLELIKNIYGSNIADDFKNSKNVLNIDECYLGTYLVPENRLRIDKKQLQEELKAVKNAYFRDDTQTSFYSPIRNLGSSSLYAGKLYAYKIFNKKSLMIFTLSSLKKEISKLSYNKALYDKSIKDVQVIRDNVEGVKARYKPADINIKY